MSNRFNWQTDDDRGWDDSIAPSRQWRGRGLRTALWILVVVASLLIGLARLGQYRLTQREEVITADILAAHATWQQAVARRDSELMEVMTNRQDSDWYASQRRLLLSGTIFGREELGLERLDESGPDPQINLSADMSTASLGFQEPYQATQSGIGQPLWLEYTVFYTRQGSRWVQRGPTEEDWGPSRRTATARTVVSFPERDRSWVERIAADLDRDLGNLCEAITSEVVSTSPSLCDSKGRVRLDFVTDSDSLLAFLHEDRPVLSGFTFELPTPTLIGLPADDAGYAVLYHAYTARILESLRQIAALPIPLPAQEVAALCSTTAGSQLGLVTYSPTEDRWIEEGGSQAYRFLRPTPDDSGLVLRAGLPGINLDRLQLTLGRDGSEYLLADVGQPQLTASLATFAHTAAGEGFVVRLGQGSTGVADYVWFPLEPCDSGQCPPRLLEGFTSWSSDNETTLINDVGELKVGDSQAAPSYSLGPGFSPFWLSPTTFGYVALSDTNSGPDMRVVVRNTIDDTRSVIVDSEKLMEAVDPNRGGRLRIRYATASAVDPSLVYVGGSPAASDSREFVIMAVLADAGRSSGGSQTGEQIAEVLLRLPTAPMSDPATFTPTGSPPFTITEDGRWLVAVRFADLYTNTWELSLVDLATRAVKVIKTHYPPYPAQFPFFDWSADGQWLVLVDDGYLQLLAPAFDYERIVPHEYRSCSYVGWIDRQSREGQ